MSTISVNSNARQVSFRRSKGVQPNTFGYLMGSALHLVRGPDRVLIRHGPNSRELAFELIFRLTIRPRSGGIESWSVFRREREWHGEADEDDPGCILWHANWDHRTDLANEAWRGDLSKETWREDRFPTIQTTVRYLPEPRCSQLGSLFDALDRIVVNGVALPEVERNDIPQWREFSLLRRLDWGGVDLTWNELRQNEESEYAGTALAAQIEHLLQEELPDLEQVDTLTMVFDWSPYFSDEVARRLLTGLQ